MVPTPNDVQTLKELMDPKNITKQKREDNALRAVSMGYQYARDIYHLPEKFIVGADGKKEWTDHTPADKLAAYIGCARSLIPEIEKDLNEKMGL